MKQTQHKHIRFAAVAAALIILAGLGYQHDLFADRSTALVVRLVGKARAKSEGGDWKALKKGSTVTDGDMIQTGDASQMVIRYKAVEIRLGPNTKARVAALLNTNKPAKVQVQEGYSWFKMDKNNPGRHKRFEVHTPTAVAGVRGTAFSVIEDGDGALTCTCEGTVETSQVGESEKHTAATGASHSYTEDGKRVEKDFTKYFKGLKVDNSFQALIDKDDRLASCKSCHRMTDIANDRTPDPENY